MKYRWLIIEIVVFLIAFMVCLALKLSTPLTVTLTVVPAFLVSYPFMKHWMPKASFAYWVTAAALSTIFGWLLYFGLKRVVG